LIKKNEYLHVVNIIFLQMYAMKCLPLSKFLARKEIVFATA